MKEADKFYVGQELYYVSRNKYGSRGRVTVEKIGRKWIQMSNRYRMDRENMLADGGNYSSPGAYYLSEEHYKEQKKLRAAWDILQGKISHTYAFPEHLTMDDVLNIFHKIFPESDININSLIEKEIDNGR